MQQEKNFGFLGFSFQQSLIRAVIEDKKFGEAIIDFLDSKYFDNNSFRYIVENIKMNRQKISNTKENQICPSGTTSCI